jgi:branched-chain amino acid transport system ATP-binding protein
MNGATVVGVARRAVDGLAPQIVEEIFETIAALNRDEGVSFLLAEQIANIALRYVQFGYVLEGGRVAALGTAPELRRLDVLRDAYLGRVEPDVSALGGGSRRSRYRLARSSGTTGSP